MKRGGNKGVRNKFDLRKDLKRMFCNRYADLLNEPVPTKNSMLTEKAKEACRMARKLIGYSPKTNDCDLYVSLRGFFKKNN